MPVSRRAPPASTFCLLPQGSRKSHTPARQDSQKFPEKETERCWEPREAVCRCLAHSGHLVDVSNHDCCPWQGQRNIRARMTEAETGGEEESTMEKKERGAESVRNWFSLAWPSLPVTGTNSGLTCVARSRGYRTGQDLKCPPGQDCTDRSLA